ncbi:MAG: sel1 repeat family protein [Phascolarctobacterium sp.]|nr:sel1 repeat family protein [Candidatus Phascolarctobacterium caballi]
MRKDLEILLQKAESADAETQYRLACMYELGIGVEHDKEEAFKWYRKAAEKGDPEAQYNLGLMYEFGTVVKPDDEEAVKWFKKAAEQGHPDAQQSLLDMDDPDVQFLLHEMRKEDLKGGE